MIIVYGNIGKSVCKLISTICTSLQLMCLLRLLFLSHSPLLLLLSLSITLFSFPSPSPSTLSLPALPPLTLFLSPSLFLSFFSCQLRWWACLRRKESENWGKLTNLLLHLSKPRNGPPVPSSTNPPDTVTKESENLLEKELPPQLLANHHLLLCLLNE